MGLLGNIGKKLFSGSRIDENAITQKLSSLGLNVHSLSVIAFQDKKTIAVVGRVSSEEDKAKLLEVAGQAAGVESVDDRVQVEVPEPEPTPEANPEPAPETAVASEIEPTPGLEPAAPEAGADESDETTHTVQPGDTLGAIARQYYGDASKYMVIFEANRPMLEDPNKIYPGQVLRIPSVE